MLARRSAQRWCKTFRCVHYFCISQPCQNFKKTFVIMLLTFWVIQSCVWTFWVFHKQLNWSKFNVNALSLLNDVDYSTVFDLFLEKWKKCFSFDVMFVFMIINFVCFPLFLSKIHFYCFILSTVIWISLKFSIKYSGTT